MSNTFALKDLGEFSYFLGIEVSSTSTGLILSQTKYIHDLLKKVNMENCKGCLTPMSTATKLQKQDSELLHNAELYRSTIGALQYVTLTRPEIAYSVNKLSQFLSQPTVKHWQACKRVLRYLQATDTYGLEFSSCGELSLHAFSDADWGCDLDDRRSIGGYCVYLGTNLINWSSKKQQVVARSSTESEYRSSASTCAEIIWLQSLFSELHIKIDQVPVIWCDNLSATALAVNPVFHSRTKHIELDIHFIREKVANGQLNVAYVPSKDQVADIFTKPLSFDMFSYFRAKLNVFPKTLSLRGDVTEYAKAAEYAKATHDTC